MTCDEPRWWPISRICVPLACVCVSLALAGGCSSDTSSTASDSGPEGSDSSVDVVDVADVSDAGARDGNAPPDTTTGDVADANDSDDAPSLTDVNPDIWEDEFFECDCPDPDAVCVELTYFSRIPIICVRPDLRCEEGGCPDGYECGREGYCECPGGEECAPSCVMHTDCHSYARCDPQLSRCVAPESCHDDIACPEDQWCVEVPEYDEICTETGDKHPGEECEEDIECASGLCDWGDREKRCFERCLRESDCPEGQSCERADYRRNKCSPESTCEVDCEEGYCRGDICEAPQCYRSGDCEGGNCLVGRGSGYESGRCDFDVEQECKDNEIQYSGDDGVYCRIAQRCSLEYEGACPPPYECQPNDEEPNSHLYVTKCARPIDEQ